MYVYTYQHSMYMYVLQSTIKTIGVKKLETQTFIKS